MDFNSISISGTPVNCKRVLLSSPSVFPQLPFSSFCGLFCSIYFGEYNLLRQQQQQIGPGFLWVAHKYQICFSWHCGHSFKPVYAAWQVKVNTRANFSDGFRTSRQPKQK